MGASNLQVAVVGAGMGGLTAVATLRQRGIDVQVYEQAEQFLRIGARIQMSANCFKSSQRTPPTPNIGHSPG